MLTVGFEMMHVRQMVLGRHESWAKTRMEELNACVSDVRIDFGVDEPKNHVSILFQAMGFLI